MCVPRLLCTPQHFKQMNTPIFADLQTHVSSTHLLTSATKTQHEFTAQYMDLIVGVSYWYRPLIGLNWEVSWSSITICLCYGKCFIPNIKNKSGFCLTFYLLNNFIQGDTRTIFWLLSPLFSFLSKVKSLSFIFISILVKTYHLKGKENLPQHQWESSL